MAVGEWVTIVWIGGPAVRYLLRHPVSTGVVALLVAAGVAVNCTLFAVVDSLLFRPLPFPDSRELIAVGRIGGVGGRPAPLSPREFRDLVGCGLSAVAAVGPSPLDEESAAAADQEVRGVTVSARFFEVLGFGPFIGRSLREEDSSQVEPLAVIVSHDIWKARLAGDPDIVGREIQLAGKLCRVVGVMPAGFDFPDSTNVWAALQRPTPTTDSFAHLRVIGRLEGGKSPETVSALCKGLVGQDLSTYMRPQGARSLAALLAASTLVLVATWVQVGALQITRSVDRAPEIRLRAALGASRRHLVVGFAREGALLSGVALAVAWVLTLVLIASLTATMPIGLVPQVPISADLRAFVFASVLSAAGVFLFAVAPFGALLDVESRSPADIGGTSRGLASVLSVAQIALTAALVYLAGLLVHSYLAVSAVDLGFDPAGVVAVPLSEPGARMDAGRIVPLEKFTTLQAEVLRLPGVVAVAGASARPLTPARAWMPVAPARGAPSSPANLVCVTPGYLTVMRTRVIRGRDFDDNDRRGAPLVCLLNETAARRLEAQTGRPILVGGLSCLVVGIVQDSVVSKPEEPAGLQLFLPASQWIPPRFLVARIATGLDPITVGARIRDTSARGLGTGRMRFLSVAAEASRATAPQRGRMVVLLALSFLGLALSSLGIYAGMSYAVFRRRHELAVRMAVGAAPAALTRKIMLDALFHVGAGLILGASLGVGAGHIASSVLFGVLPLDSRVLVVTAFLVAITSLAAALVPARRAARVNPTSLLGDN